MAELYASTEPAVATAQFGMPLTCETCLARSAMTPLPMPTISEAPLARASAASSCTSSIVGTGFGSPGRTFAAIRAPTPGRRPAPEGRERAPTAWRFHARPAASSVRSSLSTQAVPPPGNAPASIAAERSRAPRPTSTSRAPMAWVRPHAHGPRPW